MTFATRLIRKKGDHQFSAAEQTGNPMAVAAENISLGSVFEEAPIGPPRASSLYDACMRMHVLGTKLQRTIPQWLSIKDRVIYGTGTAYHEWAQNTGDLFGDRRRGWWRCTACDRVRYFGAPPRRPCKYCGARVEATKYHEHSIALSEPYAVTGHPDMFFEKVKGSFRVVEIKSMDGDSWEHLAAPLIAHQWQLQTYMWACSEDPSLPVEIDPDVGYACYVSKKMKADKLPVKMFLVQKDVNLLNRIKAKLMLYQIGVRKYPADLPDMHSDCKKGWDTYRAKFCPVAQECRRHASQG